MYTFVHIVLLHWNNIIIIITTLFIEKVILIIIIRHILLSFNTTRNVDFFSILT